MAHKVVIGTRHPKSRVHHDYSTVVSRAAVFAGLVYLIVTLFELWMLWFGPSVTDGQNEFVVLTGTAEALPRLFLTTALVYLGFYVDHDAGPFVYKALAGWLLALGVGALLVLVLLGLTYLSIATGMAEEGGAFVRWSIGKAVGSTALCVVALLPLGVLGFRTRRR
jgi:hypothetical protein